MSKPTSPLFLNKWLGLNDNSTPVEIGDTEASALENLYIINEGEKLVQRGGFSPLGTSNLGSELQMLQWTTINGTEYLLAIHNGQVVEFIDGTVGAGLPGGADRFTVGTECNGVWIDNRFIIGNGIDPNVYFDGNRVYRLQPATPTASGITLIEGSTGNPDGTFTYKVVLSGAHGNPTKASEASDEITVSSKSISVSGIYVPVGSEDVKEKRIYRSSDGGVTYNLLCAVDPFVSSITDNTLTPSGAVLTDSPDPTPALKYWTVHANRVFGAWSEADSDVGKQTICGTNYRAPWYCTNITPLEAATTQTAGSRYPLQDISAGDILGICNHGVGVAVFTIGAGHFLRGDRPANFIFGKFGEHGCVAGRTIVSVKNLLIWLAADGVYAWQDGTEAVRLSDKVRETIADFTASGMAEAFAYVFNDRYHLNVGSIQLVYDLKARAWTKNTNMNWRCGTIARQTSTNRERVYAAIQDVGRVYQLETGNTDNGSAISCVWAGRDWDMGQQAREKRIDRILALFKAGTGTCTVKLYRDTGQLIQTVSHNLATVRVPGATISQFEYNAVEQARAEYFRLRIECDSSEGGFELLSAGLHFTVP